MERPVYKHELVERIQRNHGAAGFVRAARIRGSKDRDVALRMVRALGASRFREIWRGLAGSPANGIWPC